MTSNIKTSMGITWLRQCEIPVLTCSTRMHPTIPIHTMLVLNVAQQAVMQTFLGKGLFLSVAPSVLPPVSWTLDKVHLHIHNWIVICFRGVSWWNIQPSCFSYNNPRVISMSTLCMSNLLYKYDIHNGARVISMGPLCMSNLLYKYDIHNGPSVKYKFNIYDVFFFNKKMS